MKKPHLFQTFCKRIFFLFFTFTGPSSGNANGTSTVFTVTPNNSYTGTITLTPTGGGSVGLLPIVVTFSNSSTFHTFTITPTTAGSITLTPTNNGSLTNPSNLTYTVNGTIPGARTSVTASAGNAQATVSFTSPASNGGSVVTNYLIYDALTASSTFSLYATTTSLNINVVGLNKGISYELEVFVQNSIGTSSASIIVTVIPAVPTVVIVPPPVFNGGGGCVITGLITGTSNSSGSVAPVGSPTLNPAFITDPTLISSLAIQIASLTLQLQAIIHDAQLQGIMIPSSDNTTISVNSGTSGGVSEIPVLTKNLALHDTDPQVRQLQIFLNTHGFKVASKGDGSTDHEINVFGIGTLRALERNQDLVGLQVSGYFRPKTIEFVNNN